MGSRSRNHDEGGVPRFKRTTGKMLAYPGEPFREQRIALDHVRDYPESTLEEVAEACFDHHLGSAWCALNPLRNRGILVRKDDRYTLAEEYQ